MLWFYFIVCVVFYSLCCILVYELYFTVCVVFYSLYCILQSVLFTVCVVFYSLCCISPVLAARSIPGCTVTVGQDSDTDGKWPYAGTAGACQSMGAKHVNRDVSVSFTSSILHWLCNVRV
jgi:hypothetical protein